MKKKILQVPVIVGKGSEQFFVEKDLALHHPILRYIKLRRLTKSCNNRCKCYSGQSNFQRLYLEKHYLQNRGGCL